VVPWYLAEMPTLDEDNEPVCCCWCVYGNIGTHAPAKWCVHSEVPLPWTVR
jgi:hypothetical protein